MGVGGACGSATGVGVPPKTMASVMTQSREHGGIHEGVAHARGSAAGGGGGYVPRAVVVVVVVVVLDCPEP